MKRKVGQVGPVEGYEDEVLKGIKLLDAKCSSECYFTFSYLHENDPLNEDYCGEMDRKWLLYAMSMEDCNMWRIVVSLPLDMASPCFIHGIVPAGGNFRQSAYNLAAPQLGVQNRSWDPIK